MNRNQQQVDSNQDQKNIEWQSENLRLRAGEGSAYDKFRHRTHKGGYGYENNRVEPSGTVHINMNRDFHRQKYKQDFLGGTIDYENHEEGGYGRRARPIFNRHIEISSRFIEDVADFLRIDFESALYITRAVFKAIRDRVYPGFAVHFGQALPLILRGIYFEQYNLSTVPVVIRDKNQFINFIQEKLPLFVKRDFRNPNEIIMALRGVFRVLERNMNPLIVEEMKRLLHSEIEELIDSNQYKYN